jgi:hypothetical protein
MLPERDAVHSPVTCQEPPRHLYAQVVLCQSQGLLDVLFNSNSISEVVCVPLSWLRAEWSLLAGNWIFDYLCCYNQSVGVVIAQWRSDGPRDRRWGVPAVALPVCCLSVCLSSAGGRAAYERNMSHVRIPFLSAFVVVFCLVISK